MKHYIDSRKVLYLYFTGLFVTFILFLIVFFTVFYLFYVGWYIEFRLGPSLFGREVNIYTNIPLEGSEFDRKIYNRLEWVREWSSDDVTNDDSSLSCLLQMNKAGSFHYYYEHKGQKLTNFNQLFCEIYYYYCIYI